MSNEITILINFKMLDLKNVPVLVWLKKVKPIFILKWTTIFNLVAYLIFMTVSITTFSEEDTTLPSLSVLIGHNRELTITYTIMVFIHSYTLASYLIIASEYVGIWSMQFRFLAMSAFIYWFSLIFVVYLPKKTVKNPHNIFAVVGFVFSVFTVYLHKHTFLITERGKWPRLDFGTAERYLVVSEVVMIFTISVLGILFWTNNLVVAEYIFIALILADKYFKVIILEKSGLLNIENAYLEYRYFSPPNNEYTGLELYQPPKF